MTAPKFLAPAQTDFARRVRRALEFAGLDATEAAAAVQRTLPPGAGGKRPEVKPQTIQYMAQKANKSNLTRYLAKVCGVDPDWLLDESGASPTPSVHEPTPPYVGTGLLNERKREQIGNRLFSEIEKTKQTVRDVAARLRMTERDFRDRASHGDLSLEDLAEIVLFLGDAASLDFIVLGRLPKGDATGPFGEILAGVKARARSKAHR